MRDFDAWIAYLEARLAMPFAWGSDANDCISFADGAVHALTGRRLVHEVGHRWRSARGASRVLHKVGGIVGAVDLVLPQIAPAAALRGDVGRAMVEDRESLVVFEGRSVVGPGPHGLVRLPRELVTHAWSVA